MAKMVKIRVCGECPWYDRDTAACAYETDDTSDTQRALGHGQAPPPSWCPLPDYPTAPAEEPQEREAPEESEVERKAWEFYLHTSSVADGACPPEWTFDSVEAWVAERDRRRAGIGGDDA